MPWARFEPLTLGVASSDEDHYTMPLLTNDKSFKIFITFVLHLWTNQSAAFQFPSFILTLLNFFPEVDCNLGRNVLCHQERKNRTEPDNMANIWKIKFRFLLNCIQEKFTKRLEGSRWRLSTNICLGWKIG